MIYSASRRTDMVAFAPTQIVEKVRRSRKLEGIVFWTKDIRNLADHGELNRVMRDVPAIVQFTTTGLGGSAWEPGVPALEDLLPAAARLAAFLPAGAIRWRFDPIIVTPGLRERFLDAKEKLTRALGTLNEVTVSFPDPYPRAVARVKANGLAWPKIGPEEQKELILFFVSAFGEKTATPVKLCCEAKLLSLPGVEQAHCVDGELFDSLYGTNFGKMDKDPGQRTACGCVKSTDIGSYALPCLHRCRYCYAADRD